MRLNHKVSCVADPPRVQPELVVLGASVGKALTHAGLLNHGRKGWVHTTGGSLAPLQLRTQQCRNHHVRCFRLWLYLRFQSVWGLENHSCHKWVTYGIVHSCFRGKNWYLKIFKCTVLIFFFSEPFVNKRYTTDRIGTWKFTVIWHWKDLLLNYPHHGYSCLFCPYSGEV